MPIHSQPHVVHRRVRFVSADPHPHAGSDAIAEWWGQPVWLGRPRPAKRQHACETMYIWPIVGPPALLVTLAKMKRGAWVCDHQFEDAAPTAMTRGVRGATQPREELW
jgi:hypothetical protein